MKRYRYHAQREQGKRAVFRRWPALPPPRARALIRSRLDQSAVAAHDGPRSEGDRDADACLRPGTRAVQGPPLGIRRAGRMSPTRVAAKGAEGTAFVCLMCSDRRRDDDAIQLPGQRRGASWPGRSHQQRDISDATPGCGTGEIRHHVAAIAGGWRDRPAAGQSPGQHVERSRRTAGA